jgi:hypothetical protein
MSSFGLMISVRFTLLPARTLAFVGWPGPAFAGRTDKVLGSSSLDHRHAWR